MKKRIVSLLLTVLLLLSVFPLTASAGGGVDYTLVNSGTWQSSNPGVASLYSTDGSTTYVQCESVGTTKITYTLPIEYCSTSYTVSEGSSETTEETTGAGETYTVLVLDTSGSQRFTYQGVEIYTADPAIDYVKAASNKFLTNIQSSNAKNHIAIVSYNSYATTVSEFSDDITSLKNSISSLSAGGDVNISAGLEKANQLLNSISAGDGVEKNVVLFTTGMTHIGSYSDDGPYDESTVGSTWENTETEIKLYLYANYAISVAEKVKKQANLYVVGLFQSMSDMPEAGKSIAQFFQLTASDLATSDKYYYPVTDPEKLELTFGNVADAIKESSETNTRNITQSAYFTMSIKDTRISTDKLRLDATVVAAPYYSESDLLQRYGIVTNGGDTTSKWVRLNLVATYNLEVTEDMLAKERVAADNSDLCLDEIDRYIVLVIDEVTSTSYSINSKIVSYTAPYEMTQVKQAAEKFIDTALGSSSSCHVAVVGYSNSSVVASDFSTNKTNVINSLSKINGVSDKTINTTLGLQEAQRLLDKIQDGHGIQKDVVLFTSGSTSCGSSYNYGKYLQENYKQSWYNGSSKVPLYNYSNAAYLAAENIKLSADLYTVGVFKDESKLSTDIKQLAAFNKQAAKDMATGDSYFYALDNASELNNAFYKIASAIFKGLYIENPQDPFEGINIKNFKNPFSNLSGDEWYYKYVAYLYMAGILDGVDFSSKVVANGKSGQTYPSSTTGNRSNTVVALQNLHEDLGGMVSSYKNNPFPDVNEEMSSYKDILWASYTGVVNGYDDGMFKPYNGITREQMCAIFYRYAQKACLTLKQDVKTTKFKDADSIGSWATEAVQYCQKAGIIEGYEDGTFRPRKSISNAEVTKMLYSFTKAISK